MSQENRECHYEMFGTMAIYLYKYRKKKRGVRKERNEESFGYLYFELKWRAFTVIRETE